MDHRHCPQYPVHQFIHAIDERIDNSDSGATRRSRRGQRCQSDAGLSKNSSSIDIASVCERRTTRFSSVDKKPHVGIDLGFSEGNFALSSDLYKMGRGPN